MAHPWRYWTQDEIDFLKANYKDMFYSDIGKRLGRPVGSIYHKAREIGLKAPTRERREEKDFSGCNNPNWKGGISSNNMRYKKIQIKRYPERVFAREQVKRELIKRTIVRPDNCSKCGKECKPQGHHDDYSRPLDVVWLCRACHRERHGGKH